jgi:hypothetical protein
MLHVASAAPFRHHTRAIGSIDDGALIPVQPMMNIHTSLRIVDIAAASIGACTHRASVSRHDVAGAGRRRMIDEGRRMLRTRSTIAAGSPAHRFGPTGSDATGHGRPICARASCARVAGG